MSFNRSGFNPVRQAKPLASGKLAWTAPSYVELLTCLEMARDVKKSHRNNLRGVLRSEAAILTVTLVREFKRSEN